MVVTFSLPPLWERGGLD